VHLSNHFTLAELIHSDTASREGIPNQPPGAEVDALRALCENVLEPLRLALARSVKVNSGYRGPALNQRLRGASKSQHLAGEAADIQCPGMPVVEVFKTAIRLGLPFDQIIYEANRGSRWVHVSHRPGANRGEIRVAKFGPDGRPLSYPIVSLSEAMALTERVTRSSRGVEPGYIEGADEPWHEDEPAAPAAPSQPARPSTRSRRPSVAAHATRTPAVAAKKVAAKKVAAEPPVSTSSPAKRAARKATQKAATKPAVQKATATTDKKSPPKKAATKKKPASRATVGLPAPAKKTPAKKTPARKTPARKPASSGAGVSKPLASKPAAPRRPGGPATAKKATAKKAGAKKAVAKTTRRTPR